jgi:hypothetical protein
MGLRNFERRLERLVEGTFARAFRTGLRPVEIGRRLRREMEIATTLGLGGQRVAPNHHVVRLSPGDAEQLGGVKTSLERELAEVARDAARDEGWVFMGPVRVEITTDPKLRTGRFEIDAELREAPGGVGFGSLVDDEGGRHELADRTFVIGRLPECDLQLTDPNVSRRHAELRPVEGGWVLVDLDSMNGSFVNGVAIREQRLAHADELAIGDHRLRFEAS